MQKHHKSVFSAIKYSTEEIIAVNKVQRYKGAGTKMNKGLVGGGFTCLCFTSLG